MGNPVKYVDPDGKKVYFAPGTSKQFMKDFSTAVQFLKTNKVDGLLASLHASDKIYYIAESSNMNSEYNPKTQTISWNPRLGILTDDAHEMSPTTVLNHELDHANQHDKNPERQSLDGKIKVPEYGNKEEQRVIQGTEQSTAKALNEIDENEVTRTNHFGTPYITIGPTSTKSQYEIEVIGNKK